MLEDLAELIAIPSERGEPTLNAPFGLGCRRALDWFLAKARALGFKTGELEGYCGWAEWGEGEQMLGVLCHLDVVPAGEGWTYPPYKLTTAGGKLYGRGVVDDKGSLIMCLHALKQIKDSGVKLNKRIRIIAGCDEEHGSSCIERYVEKEEMPTLSFVPDADFPVINSEKGILHLTVTCPLDKFFATNIAAIGGGGSFNVVPDRAFVSIFNDSPLGKKINSIDGNVFTSAELVGSIIAEGYRPEDYGIIKKEEVTVIEAKGVAGHAMEPNGADNAIWKLFTILGALDYDSELVTFMKQYVCRRDAVKMLGIEAEDHTGNQTVSMGIIEVDDKSLRFTLDLRCPLVNTREKVETAIRACLPPKSRFDSTYSPNLYVPKDSELVSKLLAVYDECTGEQGECLICGGGTYARKLKNAVAFGPTFKGTETNIHNIDECVPVEEFYKAAEIYRRAMIRLAAE